MATATATVLRDLLLATERATQPLDAAVRRFTEAAAEDARVLTALLDVSPQAEPLVLNWPDETGKGSRWEDRESIALFLDLITKLLHIQTQERQAKDAAEALALKIVREKSASLEKMLSWSDKPIVEFRVLELMATIVSVSASCSRELVRIFNFQNASFTKIATRRMKKVVVAKAEDDDDASPERDGIALSTTTSSTTKPTNASVTTTPTFQIRTAYVRLVAALTACPDRSVHRFALKDGGVMASLFKSLDGDDAAMLATVVSHLETLVLRNENVDLRGRMAILNNAAVQQLVTVAKSDDEDVASQASSMLSKLLLGDGALYHIPARHALRLFLIKSTATSALAIDALEAASTSDNYVEVTTVTAKIIRGVISSIGLNDYIRNSQVRGLISKLLLEYPGLAAEFLSSFGPQLEPKTGYRWFCVASMIQNVLSIPLDALLADLQTSASHAGDSTIEFTAQTLASRLIMPVSCRKELSRGLQHANNLIMYGSLGLIECALRRFQFVQSNLHSEIPRSELESELRFLLPSPETLVSLLMKLCAGVDKAALVYLRALTVFRLYLECLPLAMSESKADFTKLLAWQYLDGVDGNTSRAMRGVIVGEILRVLMVVDETRLRYVVTSGAIGEVSKLCQLLRIYTSQSTQSGEASRSLARAVLFRVFVALKVFGSGTDVSSPTEEISVWLDNMTTGGDAATAFVETILQDLLSDPFSFLLAPVQESVSPSPATLALIAAMKSNWPLARSTTKLDAVLQNVAVSAFGSRVLMSLMCQSAEPTVVARLLCIDDSSAAEEDNGQRSTKKRRRSDSIDLANITPFQCVVATAHMILTPTTVRKVKPSTSILKEWKAVKSHNKFGDTLFALHAAAFVEQFPKIVEDLLRLHLSPQWLHHYIGARPDVDLVALTEAVIATAKKNKHVGPMMRDLLDTIPLHLLSQRILFTLCVDPRDDQNMKNVSKLIHQLKARVGATHLIQSQPRVLVLVAEQLLCCVEIARNAESANLLDSLSDLLLCLQVHSGTSDSVEASGLGSRRIYEKLKRATSMSATSSHKLRALDLITLSRAATDGIFSDAEWLRLRQSGSTVTTAVLARFVPVALRLQILSALLRSQSKTLTRSPLVSYILETLNDASSIAEFKHGAGLSQRLWSSLSPLDVVGVDGRDFRVLSAGLRVVARLGGVTETSFRDSVSPWAQYLQNQIDKQSGQPLVSFGELVLFVRRLGAVIRLKDIVGATSSAFEELIHQLLKSSYAQEHGQLTAVAALLVATHGSSGAVAAQEYAQDRKLLAQAIDEAVQVSSTMPLCHAPLGLIVFRHAVLTHEHHPSSMFPAIQKVLTSFKKAICPSSSQLLALLLSLRGDTLVNGRWPAEIAVFVVRSAIAYALKSDAAYESSQRALQSLHLILRDLLEQAPSEEDVRGVATKVSADVKRLVAIDIPSETAAYFRFVRASRVVTRLFEQLKHPLKNHSIGEHFKKLTSHTLFSASLRDSAIRAELLWVVASMLRLGGADLYSRTLFQHLLGAYDVSLSLPDRMIRSLLDDFESKVGVLASQYEYRFGSSCMAVQSQKQDGSMRSDLIEDSAWIFSGGLEPARIRATIEWFPLHRGISVKHDAALLLDDVALNGDFEDNCGDIDESSRAIVYDPSYLLPMFARYVASSALPEAAIIQQGVVGVALRAVSSNADDVREYAYAILAHVHESLSADAATDFKPGRQVHLMLDTLRNALQEPLEGVSSAITVFMNDAISILGRPGHTMYPHVNHFLLARPAFDLSDVPMFYSLFNSHSAQTYKQERSWLLHGLRRGVREDADVSLLIRRHVPSILLSFFGSDLADDHTQLLVCSILVAMLKTEAGAQYLLTKCAFLEWLTCRFHEAANAAMTPMPILTALCTLLEESLKTALWDDLDGPQHLALGSAAVNCYETLVVSVQNRRALIMVTTKSSLARIARLVLQRAAVSCSLSTFASVFLHAIDEADDAIAIDCVDEFITDRLLTHHEFQKARFVDWSKLLARVTRILAQELRVAIVGESPSERNAVATTLGRELRATASLQRLRRLLVEAPTLKLLVLEDLAGDLTTWSLVV